jgi:ribosomal protein L33
MQEKKLEEEFIEKGAYLEHERWSKWQSYFFSKCSVKPQSQVNGMDDRYIYLALPKDLYERWVRQTNTNYTELTEQEKESDRLEVRKYVPLLKDIISSREEKAREEGRKEALEELKIK